MTGKDSLSIQPGRPLRGVTPVPGDKSLSHRAVLLGAIAAGTTQVRDWLAAGDTEATLRCVQQLGIQVERHDARTLTIHGGLLQQLDSPLNMVNAGTGFRLLAGILCGQPFESVLDGSEQLRRRPMKRIITPLQMMGANLQAVDGHAPLHIRSSKLHGIRYEMPIASAQVKSAILLAGLFANSATLLIQPGPARDHTERMLAAMGADIAIDGDKIVLQPGRALHPIDISVPGDFSSAAFLLVAGAIVPNSDITITHVNLNPTRTGLLDVLLEMGADITVTETGTEAGEPVGDLRVRYSELKGVTIGGETVVRMIDEFPILMVAALHAVGETVVRDAQELRVKETDRLAVMTGELAKMGAVITETPDGFRINGNQILQGAVTEGHDDHRVAMSLAIAGLVAERETVVNDSACAGDSFPGFTETLENLGGQLLEHAVV